MPERYVYYSTGGFTLTGTMVSIVLSSIVFLSVAYFYVFQSKVDVSANYRKDIIKISNQLSQIMDIRMHCHCAITRNTAGATPPGSVDVRRSFPDTVVGITNARWELDVINLYENWFDCARIRKNFLTAGAVAPEVPGVFVTSMILEEFKKVSPTHFMATLIITLNPSPTIAAGVQGKKDQTIRYPLYFLVDTVPDIPDPTVYLHDCII